MTLIKLFTASNVLAINILHFKRSWKLNWLGLRVTCSMTLGCWYRFKNQICHFSTQINPVITNKNDRSRAVRYNRV